MNPMKNAQRKQAGFTLIELVIVIVVLGVLASFAVPKIGSLVERARISKVQALSGSLKAAATIAHAQQLAEQSAHDGSTDMNGSAVTMNNRYPTADAAGIDTTLAEKDGFTATANAVTGAYVFALDNAGVNGDGANCSASYTAPTNLGDSPVVSVDVTDCK